VCSSISVVVPVHDGAGALVELVGRICAVLEQRPAAFEILLVDDGSTDPSWPTITSLCAANERVSGIRLARNAGQQQALLCGIAASRFEVVVTIDDDLQNPPEEIPKLLDAMAGGGDLVYGVPQRVSHGVRRRMVSHAGKWLLFGALRRRAMLHLSSFRAFRSELRRSVVAAEARILIIDSVLVSKAKNVRAVAVAHHPRRQGGSSYGFLQLAVHSLRMVQAFSVSDRSAELPRSARYAVCATSGAIAARSHDGPAADTARRVLVPSSSATGFGAKQR
jgi:glycosyltransferase involved in cell wall biosynthesis